MRADMRRQNQSAGTGSCDSGSRLPVKLESNSAFSAGGAVTQSVDFSVEEPGIYSVIASAKSKKVRADETTALVQPVVHEILWLLVDETDGRVLDGYDPDAIPEGYRRQPGPFREVRPGAEAGEDGQGGLAASFASSASCGSNEVCVEVSYFDSDLETSLAVPDVYYEYTIADGQTDYLEYEADGYTDEDGVFKLGCPSVGEDVSGSVSLDNSVARIVPNARAGSFNVGLGDCGHKLDIVVSADEGRTWTNAMYSIGNSRDQMNSRSKINIAVNQPSRYPNCHWDRTTTTIKMLNTKDDDCIWGGYGVFAFAHEYGHAVHEELGGGIQSINYGCSRHYPGAPVETLSCAYKEGWANYHALITLPTEVYPSNRIKPDRRAIESKYENNSFYSSGMDGSLDEGPVMSFFYDLFDGGSGESHDLLDLDVQDVLSVMGSCKVLVSGSWIRPAGIDHLIWCLENQVDSDITGGDDYFTTRDPHPTKENQSNHSWNETHVRKLWLKNLYNVTG